MVVEGVVILVVVPVAIVVVVAVVAPIVIIAVVASRQECWGRPFPNTRPETGHVGGFGRGRGRGKERETALAPRCPFAPSSLVPRRELPPSPSGKSRRYDVFGCGPALALARQPGLGQADRRCGGRRQVRCRSFHWGRRGVKGAAWEGAEVCGGGRCDQHALWVPDKRAAALDANPWRSSGSRPSVFHRGRPTLSSQADSLFSSTSPHWPDVASDENALQGAQGAPASLTWSEASVTCKACAGSNVHT